MLLPGGFFYLVIKPRRWTFLLGFGFTSLAMAMACLKADFRTQP